MNPTSDLVPRLAASLALQQFPHKTWNTLTDEEKKYCTQDVLEFMAALQHARLQITEIP